MIINFKLLITLSLALLTACSTHQDEKILIDHDVYKEYIKDKEGLRAHIKEHFVEISVETKEEAYLIKEDLHHIAHELGRCGGFTEDTAEDIERITKILDEQKRNHSLINLRSLDFKLKQISESQKAFEHISKESLKSTVEFLTSYETRSARASNPNKPLNDFINKINEELVAHKDKYTIRMISHRGSNQGSIHVRILGAERANEVVVIGGHIDSIAGFFSSGAPGADDNASGSAIVYESLKALLSSGVKPQRTIDFFWYGAEEQGLIGSKEIAQDYLDRGVDVVAAMQLDMVLCPGNGDVIGLTEDYTDPTATAFIEEIVTTHLNLPVERFKCGYGCSDHASWFRSGFKTVYPFEATFRTHNRNIHTTRDVIDERLSFDHGLRFAKIATSFLLETAQSNLRF
jgi:leucyl aminopeptidase